MIELNSYDENGDRVGHVIEGPDEAELYWSDGCWHLATRTGERELEAWEVRAYAHLWGEVCE